MTASVAAGLSSLGGEVQVAGDTWRFGRQIAVGYGADVTLHLRLIGIGLSAFGAASPDHRYNAVAPNVSLGKIH